MTEYKAPALDGYTQAGENSGKEEKIGKDGPHLGAVPTADPPVATVSIQEPEPSTPYFPSSYRRPRKCLNPLKNNIVFICAVILLVIVVLALPIIIVISTGGEFDDD